MRLIDADALINELNNNRYPGAPYVDTGIRIAIEKVCDAPTIEERKRGGWIKMPYHVTECSECGFSLEDWIQGAFYNYCPNCGADMRGAI